MFFFFKQKTAYDMRISDWSSDVCSSDLEAERIARELAEGLDYVGVLAVELFDCGDHVLVNEMAPRVHNSGHWTMDAAVTSQFEQHIRAICGLPLGDGGRLCDAVMENLIGDEIDAWPALLAEPNADRKSTRLNSSH